jgi:hypothetical protein
MAAHTKAVQQQRELVFSYKSSAAAEGAGLLMQKLSSTGSLLIASIPMQQHRELVCGYQSNAAAELDSIQA